MSFLEELAEYTDAYGLVHPNKNPGPGNWSGNGLLFTAEALVLMADLNLLTPDNLWKYMQGYLHCESIQPGLFRRHPVAFLEDQESLDDYTGIGAASYFVSPLLAEDVLRFGRENHWVMANVPPYKFSWSAWLGRFPALICHLEFAHGDRSSLWKRLWWAATVAFQPWSSESDPILSWLMVRVCANRSWICARASDRFWRRLKRKYPGGMKDVFTVYFGPDHPIAKYS